MGCGNPKEKIEDEIMKVKLERIAIHMERMNQMKLLENIEGHPIKCPIIPDYIADDFILNKNKNGNNSDALSNKKINNSRIKSKRSKSSIYKKIELNENGQEEKKRKINKKKTSKY